MRVFIFITTTRIGSQKYSILKMTNGIIDISIPETVTESNAYMVN